ncbi:uncharacterized protein AKAW2_40488A [Aspergillus luchuensis]|uniref:Uncharacterized protein n=1 Tax=Aspergillus kawachii TaxID=1069201 RepID=A0A7R7W9D4_ASPKA|nr:uncharacterized protein AKAW2_40488A [Aspergillus luchuensis]BCR98805.1 hypothetical protein AKAW2_40488A [Aspergillus luchuensis]BCS11122.1 hypothetical protein ALUC_40462A [Aspergillus luchuensis]
MRTQAPENCQSAEEEKKKELSSQNSSHCMAAGLFGRVVADEGHMLKTISTRVHQVIDICGFLTILYKEEWDDIAAASPGSGNEEYQQYAAQETTEPAPLFLLSPNRFVKLIRKGHLEARAGHYVLKAIMPLICLRRDMGERMDIDGQRVCVIGGEIPPIKVGTVKLRYPPAVQEDHDLMYNGLTQRLKGVGGALEKLTAEDIQGAGGTMDTTAVR